MVGIFFPTLGVLLHAPYVLEVAAAWVSLEVTASIGFFEFFLLIFNKRTMRLIVSIYRQRKDKYLRRKERLPSYMRRAHSLLAEINHSDLQFDDGGMLGNMFENATKIAMIQVFIMLSLRFQIKKLSKKAKKRYHFCFGELEELYEKVHVLHIKSCIFYIVPINSLSLSEYSPEKFGKLKCFYITDNILYSFLYPHNYLNLLNLCKEQGGNSAAFLFSTFDQKFILKTITKSERKIFVSTLLPAYLERLETTPKSKIVKIFGVFKISPLNQNVIVMENLIFCKEKCRIFDLKGSKVSRLVKGIENPEDPPCGVVLKDENFLLYGKKLKLNEEARKDIVETLINDFKMLKDCGITDYSLIVSIYSQSFELEEAEERNILKAEDGTLFSLGIIDILQEYNFSKASEKNLKAIVYNELDISVATPIDYFKRISEFLSNIFE